MKAGGGDRRVRFPCSRLAPVLRSRPAAKDNEPGGRCDPTPLYPIVPPASGSELRELCVK